MTEQLRSFIRISGDDRVHFLQGILTNDITKLNNDKIQFSTLLSPQGKILHDMFLIAVDNAIIIDTQAEYKDTLLKRLAMYKLRAKVVIEDVTHHASHITHHKLRDPRHPDLPPRDYTCTQHPAPSPPLTLGIPLLGRDFVPDSVVALDAGYDLLNAISFTKGCYVGQEVTARMHYKNIARRGFYILTHDTMPTRLALLKFEDVESANGTAIVDNIPYHATLPDWMQPKLLQFQTMRTNQ